MRNREKGQAVLLVILSLGIFLLGAIGLVIDGAQMYAHREMTQAAADAAAQAGVFSILASTITPSGTTHTCTAADLSLVTKTEYLAPCTYASYNGFMTGSDTVSVSYPGATCAGVVSPAVVPVCFNGVTSTADPSYPHPFLQVTITRTLQTTFMRFLGTSTSSVKAVATAGLVEFNSPVPIVVMHPTMSGSLSIGGSADIVITGGPPRSIQVNSRSATAVSVGIVNLTHAGPSNAGADFAVFGGPSTKPGSISLGTGHYLPGIAPVSDPFARVPTPTKPAAAPAKTPLADGYGGCPNPSGKACNLYSPGYYPHSLWNMVIKNETAVFKPGLYYVEGGDFGNDANGNVFMCQQQTGKVPPDTTDCGTPGLTGNTGTGNGMTVFLHYDGTNTSTVQLGANSNATLVGSDNASTYKGILFFGDRAAPAQSHSLGGGGAINLIGTIYLVNPVGVTLADATHYQGLQLGGNSGSGTSITGEIVTDTLTLQGTPTVNMVLNPAYTQLINQIALIQ